MNLYEVVKMQFLVQNQQATFCMGDIGALCLELHTCYEK